MRTASHALRLGLVVSLLGLAGPARAESAEDGCSVAANTPVDALLRQAENAWSAGDAKAAREALDAVASGPGKAVPWALLRAAALTQETGDVARAEALRRQALAAAKDGGAVGQVYAIAARLQLTASEAAAARAELAALRTKGDAERRWACHLVWVAQALAEAGDLAAAMALLDDVHRAAPAARSVTDAAVGLAFRTNDAERILAALHAALEAFPGDVEFTVRLANRMKLAGQRDEARALLEALLLQGEASPSLLGELLGLVSGAVSDEQLAHYTALAAQHPDLPALRMLVGVEHHYLHHFAESNDWLLRTGELMNHEPRIAMYAAMNYFRLGQQALAEQYIERARAADRPDPDIDYCRAVIRVRQDPAGSVADLRRYLAYTSHRPDVDPGKQQRVQQTLTLLEGCVNGPDPHGCVEREVVEQARALAFREHYPGTDAPDGGAGHAPTRAPEGPGQLGRGAVVAVVLVAVLLAVGLVVARRRRA